MNTSINFIRQLKEKRDYRGIILDRNGELLKRFFDPALDTIFSPNEDHRFIKWCHETESVIGGEITQSPLDKDVTQFYNYKWGKNDDPGWIFIPWFDGCEDNIQLMPSRQMAIDLALRGLMATEEVIYHKTAVVIPNSSYLIPSNLPRIAMQSRRFKIFLSIKDT